MKCRASNVHELRYTRVYFEYLMIKSELHSIYKPAADQKHKTVPIEKIRDLYLKMVNLVKDRPKRQKHQVVQIN